MTESETRNFFGSKLEPEMLLKRIGEPEDIANLASFLVSDEDARNITGSIFVSDGGTLIKPFSAAEVLKDVTK